jgi:hypothetical protein
MPLEFARSEVTLHGACGAEEALELVEWLAKKRRARVNLGDCTHLHSALLQTLLAFGPAISVPPHEPFLARWIVPLLTAARGAATGESRS